VVFQGQIAIVIILSASGLTSISITLIVIAIAPRYKMRDGVRGSQRLP
jgi:hypothetical protein